MNKQKARELNDEHLKDWNEETIKLAKDIHANYEFFSVQENWKTQKKCQVIFKDLPLENQRVMLRIADYILNHKHNFFYNQGRSDMKKEILEKIYAYDNDLKKERKRIDEDIGTPDFEVLRDMEIAFGEHIIRKLIEEIENENR